MSLTGARQLLALRWIGMNPIRAHPLFGATPRRVGRSYGGTVLLTGRDTIFAHSAALTPAAPRSATVLVTPSYTRCDVQGQAATCRCPQRRPPVAARRCRTPGRRCGGQPNAARSPGGRAWSGLVAGEVLLFVLSNVGLGVTNAAFGSAGFQNADGGIVGVSTFLAVLLRRLPRGPAGRPLRPLPGGGGGCRVHRRGGHLPVRPGGADRAQLAGQRHPHAGRPRSHEHGQPDQRRHARAGREDRSAGCSPGVADELSGGTFSPTRLAGAAG